MWVYRSAHTSPQVSGVGVQLPRVHPSGLILGCPETPLTGVSGHRTQPLVGYEPPRGFVQTSTAGDPRVSCGFPGPAVLELWRGTMQSQELIHLIDD